MKLIEFGSRYSFYKWFYKHDRSDNYPLTDLNYRHCGKTTHIFIGVLKKERMLVLMIKKMYLMQKN